MYEFWYDYVKPKHAEKVKLCYMDTDIFFLYVKTGNIYKHKAEDIVTKFNTSSYELDRSLLKGKNKKSNWINEKWIRWINHKKIFRLGAKTYTYLID